MRNPIFLFIAVLVPLNASAKTPIGDWQVVQQDIPRGWHITVVTSFTFPCVFVQATSDEIVCNPVRRNQDIQDVGEIHVLRERIREIRVERREGANMLAGAAGGGGLGAVLGALLIAGGRGPAAYAFGLGGISMGARSARDVHILHGKVIYRRSVEDHSR